jgi:curved DNA-binding protein CbpA
MDPGDDAYDVLGVPKDATPEQIKIAYRKLALKYHPDKQSTDEARERSTVLFVKFSNAYEILRDESTRRDYDQERERPSSSSRPSHNDWEEPPSRAARPSSSRRARAPAHQRDNFREHFRFHDPFQVFEQVFGQDFFSGARAGRSAFEDPFFSGGNIHRGGRFGDPSMFGSMMGGGMMGGGGGGFLDDPFFGGGGGFGRRSMNTNRGADPFASMHQSMMSMPMNSSSSVFFGSNSMGNFPGASSSVSTSTTTRIVNGRAQTVTETTVQKPDGTVERHVQTQGGPEEPPTRRQPHLTTGTNDASPPRRGPLGFLGGGRKKSNDSEPASSSLKSKAKGSSETPSSSSRGNNHLGSSRQRSSSKLEQESAPEKKKTKRKGSKK